MDQGNSHRRLVRREQGEKIRRQLQQTKVLTITFRHDRELNSGLLLRRHFVHFFQYQISIQMKSSPSHEASVLFSLTSAALANPKTHVTFPKPAEAAPTCDTREPCSWPCHPKTSQSGQLLYAAGGSPHLHHTRCFLALDDALFTLLINSSIGIHLVFGACGGDVWRLML